MRTDDVAKERGDQAPWKDSGLVLSVTVSSPLGSGGDTSYAAFL